MAKVKAPLLSHEARGKLADAVVHFPWKGINCVREYVIPANPQTIAQTTQRTRMTDANTEWHGAVFTSYDRIAWNRLAGLQAKTMSGFNIFCKTFIDEDILGNTWERMHWATMLAALTTSIAFRISKAAGGNAPRIRWGRRKTFMPSSATMVDGGDGTWSYTITGLVANTLYYITFDVGTSGTDYGRLGIYEQRTAAA